MGCFNPWMLEASNFASLCCLLAQRYRNRCPEKPIRCLFVLLVATAPLFNACAAADPAVRRCWIVGFGCVDTVSVAAVDAQSLTAAGVVVGSEGFKAGIIQSHSTAINPAKAGNTLVGVEAKPFHLRVQTQRTPPIDSKL